MSRSRFLAWGCALALWVSVIVDAQAQISTTTVAPPPSGSASFTVTMTNNGSAVVPQPLFSLSPISSSIGALSVSEPCWLVAGPLLFLWELRAPAMDAGERLTCDVTFTRTALSPIFSFAWRPRPSLASANILLTPSTWAVGQFDDPSIAVEPVSPLPFPGATEAVFRITVNNPGDTVLTDVEAGGCQFVSNEMVTMDTDILGGCGGEVGLNVFCFSGSSDFSVSLPDVPAHSQSSCLVRARRLSGLIEGTGWPFELFFWRDSVTDSGYRVGDSNSGNNYAEADVAFSSVGQAIPTGRPGMLAALAIAILTLALSRIRREKQALTNGVSP